MIDYLQLLRPSKISRNESRVLEISEITQGLKALAKELNELRISVGVGDLYKVLLLEALDVDTREGVVSVSCVHYTSVSDVEKLISGLDRLL